MNKWGVRLIALLFVIRVILHAYNLITYTGPAGSYSGWVMEFGEWNINTDFMAWAEIIILAYAGFQLFRFQPSGRYWALFTLWISTLVSGVFLVRITGVAIWAFYQREPIEAYFTVKFWNTVGTKVDGVIPLLLVYVGNFVFYLVPTYYLMRKDVKQLFEKPIALQENVPTSNAPSS